jgi:hypothetical protein
MIEKVVLFSIQLIQLGEQATEITLEPLDIHIPLHRISLLSEFVLYPW